MRAGQGGHHVAASLGLPPRVNDGAAAAADNIVIPIPGFGVDRLADRAQHLERGKIAFFDIFVALTHERAQSRGGGVELVDLVLFTNLPEAGGVRVGGCALEHQRCCAVRKRPVNDIAVARDPADIGGAPVDVAIVVIKRDLLGHRGPDEIAAGAVHNAFWLACGA